MRLAYGEGLRVPKTQWRAWDREKYFYQKGSYARGYIFHHRSNATQQWLFHFMYGGFQGFFVNRVAPPVASGGVATTDRLEDLTFLDQTS